MKRAAVLLCFLLLATVGLRHPDAVFSSQYSSKVIVVEGRVVNGTTGNSPVTNLPVLFHQESLTQHEHLETVTDELGRFLFQGIVFDTNVLYGVSVAYMGELYGVDLDLSAGSHVPITLTVYDTTNNEDSVSISSISLLLSNVDPTSRMLFALEIVRLKNHTKKTYVPGPQPMKMLRFGLPPGALELSVETSLKRGDFIQVDKGFALTSSIPPGDHEVMYSYHFPYSGSEITFSKSILYGAGNIRVLSPLEVGHISSSDLGKGQEIQIGNRSYQLLEGTDMQRNEAISISISELPVASFANRLQNRFQKIPLQYYVLVGLCIFMASLITFGIWRRKTLQIPPKTATTTTHEPKMQ